MKNGEYELVIAPDNYPGQIYRNRYCLAHILAYQKAYGIIPNSNEVVHHIDGNKYNNDPSNLQLMTREAHSELHNKTRIIKLVEFICPGCGNHFIKPRRTTFLIKGGMYNCCSKKCANKVLSIPKEELDKKLDILIVREFEDIKSNYTKCGNNLFINCLL